MPTISNIIKQLVFRGVDCHAQRKNAVDIASAITGDKMFSTNRKFNFAAVISTIMGVAMLVLLLIALCM